MANISRNTFNETKKYDKLILQQGVPVLDADVNEAQDIQRVKLRRFIEQVFGNFATGTGFKIVGTGATNAVTCKAGPLFIGGYQLTNAQDFTVNTPEPTDGTQLAYVDVWEEEIDSSVDPDILDDQVNIETCRRVKIRADVYVGAAVPVSTSTHLYYKLAEITRSAGVTAVASGVVLDTRQQGPFFQDSVKVGGNLTVTELINGIDIVALSESLAAHKVAATIDHPDNSVTDAKIGNRTVNQAIETAYGNTGALTTILSFFAKSIKELKGTTNWYDAAANSIADFAAKFHSTTGHKHTGTAGDAPKIATTGLANDAATDTIIGNRTVTDSTVPAADTQSLTVLLSNMANMIKKLSGKASWRTDPSTSIEGLASDKAPKANPTFTGVVTLAQDPVNALEAATKQYADSAGAAAGNGLSKVGNAMTVNVDNTGIEIVDDTLQLKDSGATDAKIGSRVVNSDLAGGANTGTPTQLWSWLAKLIKSITEEANWWTVVGTGLGLKSLWAYFANYPFMITANTTLYVATTGNDTTGDGTVGNPFATPQKALLSLKFKYIPSGVTVTILLADGTYNLTSTINTYNRSRNIKINGTNTYSKTLSSIASSSGGTGNWSIILNLTDVDNIAVGDYVLIPKVTGGTGPNWLPGCWEITNVDTGNKRITIKSTHIHTTAPSGNVTGTITIVKSILSFTDCPGMEITTTGLQFYFSKLVFKGDLHADYWAIQVLYGSSIQLGSSVGINGFAYGILINMGGMVYSGYVVYISNCSGVGVYALNKGVVTLADASVVSGGASYGFNCQNGSMTLNGIALSTGNGSDGFVAQYMGTIYCPSAIAERNIGTGFYAHSHGVIYAAGYASTNNGAAVSPAVNTLGNEQGYINT